MTHYHPATRKDQDEAIRRVRDGKVDVYLVVKRRPLSEKPALWRWLARFVYWKIQWSSDYGIEYQGVYTEESAARHAASGEGMSYSQIPLDVLLPEETCQYGVHDFPLSESSAQYRNRSFPLVAIPQVDLENLLLLEAKVNQTLLCAYGECADRLPV